MMLEKPRISSARSRVELRLWGTGRLKEVAFIVATEFVRSKGTKSS
jgi:hypothetical protein